MKQPVIGIIGGRGQMGSLFADFFVKCGLKVLISDVSTKLKNHELAAQSDIVIVSVPIDLSLKVINEVLPFVKKGNALMDLTSVKQLQVDAMLKGNCEVLGLHPMFGSTNPIPGQTVIVCHTKKSGPWSGWLEEFLKKNNVNLQYMKPKEHDQMMNVAQGLIHFAEIAFSDGLRRSKVPIPTLLKFTGKASELKILLAARILAQDSSLYGNIQLQNPIALASLKKFKAGVDELYNIVAKKDLKAFKKYFERNQKFFGKYLKDAYSDSSNLIDYLLTLKSKSATPESKPTLRKPSKTDLAVLGPENTFSDFAADKYLALASQKTKKFYCREITDVFELVEKGQVKEGIVPVENKIQGTIRETLDNLFERKVHTAGEIELPISHCLITLKGSKKTEIKKITSHTQALNQCQNYLRKKFPKADKLPATSTTAAIEELIKSADSSLAIIASEKAISHYSNLQITAANIQDRKDNTTKFLLIKKGTHNNKVVPPKATNTSIAFHFDQDSPGSLFTVFKDFADAKINLTRIESRPTKASFGDYIFYLDFQGTPQIPNIQKTLSKVTKKVAKLKVLGCY